MIRSAFVAIVCAVLLLTIRVSAAGPFDVQVGEPVAPSGTVSATVQVRDVLPDKFRKVIDDGGVLHLRIQTELWERRPAWDRLIYPAIVRVLRLARGQSAGDVSVTAGGGAPPSYAVRSSPLPVIVDIGSADRLNTSERYYVHTVATLGTLADREADTVSDALFGRESDSSTIGALGRLVFRKVLQISDYLQSVSAEARSGTIAGGKILHK